MHNLPTITVLAERSEHRTVWLSMQCLLCDSGPEMAHHLWECPVQSHEWRPARQRQHTWLSTYVGPQASEVQGQLWDSVVLEQWPSAIATPSLRAVHMAGSTTRYGDGVRLAGVVGITEGLAGPRPSSRGPHQGPLGARGHYCVGVVRTSTAPAGGAAGSPKGGPELRPLYTGTYTSRASS